jgi:hypothetical protein
VKKILDFRINLYRAEAINTKMNDQNKTHLSPSKTEIWRQVFRLQRDASLDQSPQQKPLAPFNGCILPYLDFGRVILIAH